VKVVFVPKNGQRNLLTIEVDEEPWKDVHAALFKQHLNVLQKCPSFDELQVQFAEIEYRLAKQYTLKLLAKRSYYSSEIKKKLELRFISKAAIQRITEECIHFGFLNDEEWLKTFVMAQQARHLGPHAIRMKLKAKGLPLSMFESAFEALSHVNNQKEQIMHLLKTRYKRRNLADFKEKQKVIASLIRRGYDLDEIKTAFDWKLRYKEQD
jgi:regulatory protein